jgi:hypothetical protein
MELPFGPDRARRNKFLEGKAAGAAPQEINMKAYLLCVLIGSLVIGFVPITLMIAAPEIGDAWFDAFSEQDVIEQGAAHGVEIGRGKSQTFRDLESLATDKPIIVSGAGLEGSTKRFLLSDKIAHDILMARDHWHLLFEETTIDVLRLHFSDGKLSKIIRVRTPRMPRKRWG